MFGTLAVSVALAGMRNCRTLVEHLPAVDWRHSDDRAEIDRVFAEEGVPAHVETPQDV